MIQSGTINVKFMDAYDSNVQTIEFKPPFSNPPTLKVFPTGHYGSASQWGAPTPAWVLSLFGVDPASVSTKKGAGTFKPSKTLFGVGLDYTPSGTKSQSLGIIFTWIAYDEVTIGG